MLDLNVYDTYFVILYKHFGILISLVFAFLGVIYWLANQFNVQLLKWLTLSHVFLTLGGFIFICLTELIFGESNLPSPDLNYNRILTIYSILFSITSVICIGQILLPINIIVGVIIKSKKISK